MSYTAIGYALALIVGGYAALVAIAFVFQDRLLYLPGVPSRTLTATPASVGLDFEEVTLETVDGVRLHGWHVPARAARGTLLFFHGNAGNISHRLDSLALFHELDLDVLIIDYRGYGRSTGQPSEAGTYDDAEAAWRHLTAGRGIDPRRIVVFGRSLGGAVGARLAARHRPGTLIVESGFTSAPELAAEVYPFLPARRLTRFEYATERALRSVECPVLIAHSRDDEIIPYRHGRRLFEAAHEPKRFLEMSGGHNEGFLVSGARYRDGLRAFIEAHLPAAPAT